MHGGSNVRACIRHARHKLLRMQTPRTDRAGIITT